MMTFCETEVSCSFCSLSIFSHCSKHVYSHVTLCRSSPQNKFILAKKESLWKYLRGSVGVANYHPPLTLRPQTEIFGVCSFSTRRHQDWNRSFKAFLSPVLCTWKRSVDGCQSLANSQRCGHYDLAKRLLVSWLDELVTAIVSSLNVSVLALMECNFGPRSSPPNRAAIPGPPPDRCQGNHNHVLMPPPPLRPPPTPPQWEREN